MQYPYKDLKVKDYKHIIVIIIHNVTVLLVLGCLNLIVDVIKLAGGCFNIESLHFILSQYYWSFNLYFSRLLFIKRYYSATLYGHQQRNVDHQHFLLEASRKLSLTRTPLRNRLSVCCQYPNPRSCSQLHSL
jgi:hypothetical protein